MSEKKQFLFSYFPLVIALCLFGAGPLLILTSDTPPPAEPLVEPVTPPPSNTEVMSLKAITAPIRIQLDALQKGDIAGAYEVVAPEFKAAMPFEPFQEFIHKFPVLSDFKSYTLSQPIFEGTIAKVTANLQTEHGSIPVLYSLSYRAPQWRIIAFVVNEQTKGNAKSGTNLQALKELSPVVAYQLSAIRENRLDRAYDDVTTQEFKMTTPYPKFLQFLETHPILKNQTNASVITGEIGNGRALLNIVVESKGEKLPIQYMLVLEGNNWRINGLKVTEPKTQQTPFSEKEKEELLNLIKQQLTAIQANDLPAAYNKFTASEFQRTTTEKTFDLFIAGHPAFKKFEPLTYISGGMQGQVATMVVDIGDQEIRTVLDYNFVNENGSWKILSVSVTAEQNLSKAISNTPVEPFDFSSLLFGTEVDTEGFIKNPTTEFKHSDGPIHLNLYYRNAPPKTSVEVALHDLKTNQLVAPITTTIDRGGNGTLFFVFAPPPSGWPEGKYEIVAKGSGNLKKAFPFTIAP